MFSESLHSRHHILRTRLNETLAPLTGSQRIKTECKKLLNQSPLRNKVSLLPQSNLTNVLPYAEHSSSLSIDKLT